MSDDVLKRARHPELLASDNPIVSAVANLHRPIGSWPDCHGCDVGGMEGEPPSWPCSTWDLLDEQAAP